MSDAPSAGSALAELVAVMDRLRSPGGCPWDAEQTHESLLRYAVEEVHELVEAVETGDRAGLREELGDVLLQVVFHARIAAEHPTEPFDVEDVAGDLVAKLRRRHPHVFADGDARDATEVAARWEDIKQAEKGRASVLDGVPAGLPALARAQTVARRARRLGVELHAEAPDGLPAGTPGDGAAHASRRLGEVLLDIAGGEHELDAEAALRGAVRDLEDRVRAAEAAAAAAATVEPTRPSAT